MKKLLILALVLVTGEASAQYRARYYYDGEPHIGPALAGTIYDANGRNVGRSYTDSQGSKTMYDSSGRVMGRTSTDSQGVTTYYDASGRKTATTVPERR